MSISGLSSSVVSYAMPSDARQQPAQATTGASNAQEDKVAAPLNDKAAGKNAQSQLSTEALDQIRQLKARDTEVRQHEQAHLAASGGLATSGASYTYQKGPDGVNYAIGGEVNIDVSPGRTPEDSIARAKTIQAAALAPADPSGADRAVAAQAQQMEQEARNQLAEQATAGAAKGQDQKAIVDRLYGAIDRASPVANSINFYA